ncbi:hypothetical protein V1290_005475 [Bradyrhizobium sp. AZCC 1578]
MKPSALRGITKGKGTGLCAELFFMAHVMYVMRTVKLRRS